MRAFGGAQRNDQKQDHDGHAVRISGKHASAKQNPRCGAGSDMSLRGIGMDYDGFLLRRSIVACRHLNKKVDVADMRYLTVLLTVLPTCALAQELSVEDRACITAAAAKLPPVAALKIEQSRVVPQPPAQGQTNPKLYHVSVEIDVSVAGQSSTYVFNCIRDGLLTVIQPVGMR
jgi:hypothetical protein